MVKPSPKPPPVENGVVIELSNDDWAVLKARPQRWKWLMTCFEKHGNFALKNVKYIKENHDNLLLYTHDAAQSVELLKQLQHSVKLSDFEFCDPASTVRGLLQGEYWLKVNYRLDDHGASFTRALLEDEARKDLEELIEGSIETILWYSPDRLVFRLPTLAAVEHLYKQTNGFTEEICVGGYGRMIEPWDLSCERKQCHHCSGFGHFRTNCPDLESNPNDRPTCSRCSQRHSRKACRVPDGDTARYVCPNCKRHFANDPTRMGLSIGHEATDLLKCPHPDAKIERDRRDRCRDVVTVTKEAPIWYAQLCSREAVAVQSSTPTAQTKPQAPPRKARGPSKKTIASRAGPHLLPDIPAVASSTDSAHQPSGNPALQPSAQPALQSSTPVRQSSTQPVLQPSTQLAAVQSPAQPALPPSAEPVPQTVEESAFYRSQSLNRHNPQIGNQNPLPHTQAYQPKPSPASDEWAASYPTDFRTILNPPSLSQQTPSTRGRTGTGHRPSIPQDQAQSSHQPLGPKIVPSSRLQQQYGSPEPIWHQSHPLVHSTQSPLASKFRGVDPVRSAAPRVQTPPVVGSPADRHSHSFYVGGDRMESRLPRASSVIPPVRSPVSGRSDPASMSGCYHRSIEPITDYDPVSAGPLRNHDARNILSREAGSATSPTLPSTNRAHSGPPSGGPPTLPEAHPGKRQRSDEPDSATAVVNGSSTTHDSIGNTDCPRRLDLPAARRFLGGHLGGDYARHARDSRAKRQRSA